MRSRGAAGLAHIAYYLARLNFVTGGNLYFTQMREKQSFAVESFAVDCAHNREFAVIAPRAELVLVSNYEHLSVGRGEDWRALFGHDVYAVMIAADVSGEREKARAISLGNIFFYIAVSQINFRKRSSSRGGPQIKRGVVRQVGQPVENYKNAETRENI